MSSQKGNCNRTRPQKFQNSRAFKNNLYDKSKRTKVLNNLQITNVCERCKGILEWKIKYKKFKPLKSAGTCCKCQNKCVKHAYHTMCGECSNKLAVCPKCGASRSSETTKTANIPTDEELKEIALLEDAEASSEEEEEDDLSHSE